MSVHPLGFLMLTKQTKLYRARTHSAQMNECGPHKHNRVHDPKFGRHIFNHRHSFPVKKTCQSNDCSCLNMTPGHLTIHGSWQFDDLQLEQWDKRLRRSFISPHKQDDITEPCCMEQMACYNMLKLLPSNVIFFQLK